MVSDCTHKRDWSSMLLHIDDSCCRTYCAAVVCAGDKGFVQCPSPLHHLYRVLQYSCHTQCAADNWYCLKVSDIDGAAISKPSKTQVRADRRRQQKAAERGPDYVAPVARAHVSMSQVACLTSRWHRC